MNLSYKASNWAKVGMRGESIGDRSEDKDSKDDKEGYSYSYFYADYSWTARLVCTISGVEFSR